MKKIIKAISNSLFTLAIIMTMTIMLMGFGFLMNRYLGIGEFSSVLIIIGLFFIYEIISNYKKDESN